MNAIALLNGLPNLLSIAAEKKGMFYTFHPVAKNASIGCWYMSPTKLKSNRKTIMGKSP
jgi:hypothetical protein